MEVSTSFPALPGPGPPNYHNIQQAYQIVSETFHNSLQLLRDDDHDPLRVCFHVNRLQFRIFPLYLALSTEELPEDWLKAGAHALGQLLLALQASTQTAEEEYVSFYHFLMFASFSV